MKRIMLLSLLFLFIQGVFPQTGYNVVQIIESAFGIDSIHFYIDEDCFFGRRKMPSMGEVQILDEKMVLDMDEYFFIDFKSGKKKKYFIPRYENKIPISNLGPDFWDNLRTKGDSILKELKSMNNIIKDENINNPFTIENNKQIKPKQYDTVYIVSCIDTKQEQNVFSFVNIPTKTCVMNFNNGEKVPATIANNIAISKSIGELYDFFNQDSQLGYLILDAIYEKGQRKTVFIQEYAIERYKQRLLSAEYDADLIGLIQYVLKLYVQ